MKRLKKLIAEKIYLKDIINHDDLDCYGYNTDYGNRYKAIIYINGQIFEDETHKDALNEYINKNNYDSDILEQDRGFVTINEQNDLNLPMGIASYIKGIDGKDYIAIYPDSSYNLDLNTFKLALAKEYPNAIICIDNNDRNDYIEDDKTYIETI